MRRALPAAVAALAVVIGVLSVACSGASSRDRTTYGEGSAVEISGTEVTVNLKDLMFAPKAIRVRPGTTVTWVHEDAAVHNVASIDRAFESADLAAGDRFTHTFDSPGTFRYQCIYHHPSMLGAVIVESQ